MKSMQKAAVALLFFVGAVVCAEAHGDESLQFPTPVGHNRNANRLQRRRKLLHRKLEWAPDHVAIADQYIVVFSDETTKEDVDSMVNKWRAGGGPRMTHRYDSALNAVVLKRVSHNLLRRILNEDRVAYIDEVSRSDVLSIIVGMMFLLSC